MAAPMNSVYVDGANTTVYWVIQNLAKYVPFHW